MAIRCDSKITYLDGLRGIAALLVYFHHHQGRSHESVDGYSITYNAFGWNDQYYFATFPVVRWLFTGGPAAVAVFFVISGYVLSKKPLQLLRQRGPSTLAKHIASAIFRRWFRLFLPVMATTLIWAMSWHVFGWMPTYRAPSVMQELEKWWHNFLDYSFVFKDFKNMYNEQAWSIAFEFRGSLAVYTAVIAFSELRPTQRLACEGALLTYFLLLVDGPYYANFVAGMLLSELDCLLVSDDSDGPFRPYSACGSTLQWMVLLFGLYLGGVPYCSEDIKTLRNSTGWYLLSFLSPSNFGPYFRVWGATMVLYATSRIALIQRALESHVCQYLGKISFSLYLVHGPILSILGDRLYAATGRLGYADENVPAWWLNRYPISSHGPFGLEMNFLLPQAVLLPVTLMVADICTRMIERPSVRFSRWLYDRLIDREEHVISTYK